MRNLNPVCRLFLSQQCVKSSYPTQATEDYYYLEDTPLDGEEARPDADDIPIRLLHNVSIMDQTSGKMVPLAQLLELQLGITGCYFATGNTRPWLEEIEDDEDSDSEVDDDADDEQEGTGIDDDRDDTSVSSDDPDSLTPIRTSPILEMTFYHYDHDQERMDQ